MRVSRGGEGHGAVSVEMGRLKASFCLVFKGRGRFLTPFLIKSINSLSNHGNMISTTRCCAVVNFETFVFKVFKGPFTQVIYSV